MVRQRLFLGILGASVGLFAACAEDDRRAEAPGGVSTHDIVSEDDNRRGPALKAACEESADYWRRQFGAEGRALARPPFVLAGTLDEAELHGWYEQAVRPAARAMATQFFHQRPDRPVTILLFPDEAAYRAQAERLFGDRAVSRHGYFRPHLHTLVVNAASGRSALLHELTHALMAFDFPDAPLWLREGLASLNEDCRIELDPPRIVPLPAARRDTLQGALAGGRLPSLESLLRASHFDGADRAVDYALARHFCRFLDQHGVLPLVYRAVRAQQGDPADHAAEIGRALGGRSLTEVEEALLQWVVRPGQFDPPMPSGRGGHGARDAVE